MTETKMSDAEMVRMDIDIVPFGVMVYGAGGLPLGVVEKYIEANGNRRSIERRHLNNGNPADRFAYRREALYHCAKASGPVFVKTAALAAVGEAR